MAIDPSILFQGSVPTAPDPLAAVSNIFALKGQKMQMDEAKSQNADKELLGQLFAKHTVEKEGKQVTENDKILSDLFSMGKSDLALRFDQERVKRDTERLGLETAKTTGTLKELELEGTRNKQLSALARGALELEGVPEPLRQQGWQNFLKKATEIDPDLKGNAPQTFDPNWLRMGIEAGLTAEESLKQKAEGLQADADKAFRAAIPGLEKQIAAAGRDEVKLANIEREIVTKYPASKQAQEYAKALPKSKDSEAGALRRELAEGRKADRAEDQALRYAEKYQSKNDKNLAAAVQIKDVDQILDRIGIAGGIYGDADQANIPGYGVGGKAFRKWAQSEDAVDLRAAVTGLYNSYRNQLFGSALTATEKAAFDEFVGTGNLGNQKAFVAGLRKLNGVLDQALRPIGSPRTTEILKESGVLTYEDLPSQKKAQGAKAPGGNQSNPIKIKSEADAEKHVGKYVELNGQVFRVVDDGN